MEKDVFIKNSDGEILYGRVWPWREGIDPETGNPWEPKTCDVAYPDYFRESTEEWWTEEMKKYRNIVPYDAIWIDMNEPSNFRDGSGRVFTIVWIRFPKL